MPPIPHIALVLFDFDGVLARYERGRRVARLAAALEREPAAVCRALFDSGLEDRYDAGQVATADYLAELGTRLGHAPLDAALWLAARREATATDPAALALAARVAATGRQVAVLTNNGPLLAPLAGELLAPALPGMEERVLCSGALGLRKPDPRAYLEALRRLGAAPHRTLFVDDVFANVRGARQAGLHADSVRDARALGRLLRRYRVL
ncbi:HAD family hydrolase [Xanthomonas massiliensis]|uniref:HAD family hydrolase n=1 Tax=Xanthomonas massiliensis TaxID=1720302 RepID=UPI00082667FA